jgi:hypothetical protein
MSQNSIAIHVTSEAAVTTLNRQFWTVDKGWYFLLVLGGGLSTPH